MLNLCIELLRNFSIPITLASPIPRPSSLGLLRMEVFEEEEDEVGSRPGSSESEEPEIEMSGSALEEAGLVEVILICNSLSWVSRATLLGNLLSCIAA